MTQEAKPIRLPDIVDAKPKVPVFGVFAACDPRIDEDSRTRTQNVIEMASPPRVTVGD